MNLGSLRLRLLLAGALSIILALALAAAGLTLLFKRHVERRLDDELSVYLNQLTSHLERSPASGLAVTGDLGDPRFETPLSGLYWQIDPGGAGKILRSRSLWDTELALPADAGVDSTVHHHTIAGPGGTQLYLAERNIDLPARLGDGTVRIAVARDAASITNATAQFARELMLLLAVIGLLLIAAAWAQVSIGLRPLDAVRNKLAAIRTGGAPRLGSAFPTEVRPLAQEIDDLLDARDADIAKARARAADLAHGLRTPLQVLNSEIEQLRRKGHKAAAESLTHVAESMQRHVERELARARLSTRQKQTASTRVATAVDRVVRVVERIPAAQRLDWSIDIPSDLHARIDDDDLAEALGNLIENGVRHARHVLTINAHVEDGTAVISVGDDGPGIPEEKHAEVLSRGGRVDARGSGAGLGLSIVTDIANAWFGSLTLADGEPGLRAELRLPSARAPNGES
jgi:signal transduction histidine kinase